MDLLSLLIGLFDFTKLAIPLAIVCFVLFKLFSPLREKIDDRFGLGWVKSCLLLNFIIILICTLAFYFYFVVLGSIMVQPMGAELSFDSVETAVIILSDFVRILVSSIILSFALLFFEFISSLVIESMKKKKHSDYTKQFIGVLVSVIIFLVLLLFVFNWAVLGMFIYVFYGGVKPLPALLPLFI